MSILEIHDVSIRYITGDFKDIGLKEYVMRKLSGEYHVNEFWADRHISFSLEKGDMLGIIGTNGAGKSTLLKVVSGIMEPTNGWVKRGGKIAALLELGSGFDGDLTVRENAYLRGAMLGYTRKFMDEKYDQIINFAELRDFQDHPFKQLSSGMKSRLAFSIASLVQPEILILDEVLSVGDGAFRKKSERKMHEIINSGATTILVSHSLKQIREMCTKVLWLQKGEQIAFGSNVQEICDQYQAFLDGTVELTNNNYQKEKELRAEVKETQNHGIQKGNDMKMLQLRAICTLILIVTGWALMYIHSPWFIIWGVCTLLFCADWWSRREENRGQIQRLFSTAARQNLIYSFEFILLFAIVTHGFLFTNEFFSHDSVERTFYSNSPKMFQFYLSMGRFIIPLYEVMKGLYSAPWLIGLFFIIWMTLTCFLFTELFRFRGRLVIAMVSGLLCTNTALILTGATYTYCLDEYAAALFTSVAAAYCFCKVPQGKILGVLLLVLSLGIYQAYFTVTLALCFIFAVQKLTENKHAGKVVADGLKQIGLMLISFSLYFGIWTILCTTFQVPKIRTDESILGKKILEIFTILVEAYVNYFKMFLNSQGLLGYVYITTNIILSLLFLRLLWRTLRKKNMSRCNKGLIVTSILCVPLTFNSAKIVLTGEASDLTGFGCELIYIFFLMLLWNYECNDKTNEGKTRIVVAILIGCVIYNGILLANQVYMKKGLEKTATISLVTRIIDRVEQLEGYSPNDTQVYVVGELWHSDLNKGKMDVPYLESQWGLWSNYAATYNLPRYITEYMNYPIQISAKPELADSDEVRNMPAFPAVGSAKMIDGAAVIKLS